MDIFFELLQASIGTRRSLSRRPTADEWHRLMDTSVQHGLTALTFGYVRNLPTRRTPTWPCAGLPPPLMPSASWGGCGRWRPTLPGGCGSGAWLR